jgi:hypothetical protein
MSKSRMLLLSTVAAALLGCYAGAGQAFASHGEITYFEGSNTLLGAKTRSHAMAQLRHLGVKALRIELSWGEVAPYATKATKPAFDATNPINYNWGQYDPLIEEANRLHWQILLTVTAPVPRWATSNRKAPYVTRPDDRDFQEFMTAVGRHFGSLVQAFSIWNEPNHPAFLRPQFSSRGKPESPRIYRGLYQAGYAGLQAAGIANPKVLFGETAPTGYDKVKRVRHEGVLHDVAPLAFLRGALCLNNHYRKAGSCGELQMAGYAHHAYTIAVAPTYHTPGADNVTIGTLARLSHALDRAARAHAIPAHIPMYLTEFGVQSFPNRQLGVRAAKQAEYDAMAEHIAWSNPRVAAFSQYLLKDDPLGGRPGASVHGGVVGFQTGLEYANGRAKPLYAGWPVPLAVSKHGHHYALWGLVRPAEGPTTLTVLVRSKHAKRYGRLKVVHTDAHGYWALNSSRRAAFWRVRWVSPTGVKYEGPPIRAH